MPLAATAQPADRLGKIEALGDRTAMAAPLWRSADGGAHRVGSKLAVGGWRSEDHPRPTRRGAL